ncbi:hypothetical protein C5167_050056, partial [Papaver somniferum]
IEKIDETEKIRIAFLNPVKNRMGSEDRNFWISDIGQRFKDLYCFGCKAGSSGEAFMAMLKSRLVNEPVKVLQSAVYVKVLIITF